jgi:molybdopterin-guanine dinucleotide biosynthesis protein A
VFTPGPIAGLILAGGQGSRMGGRDKGLVAFRGEPMIAQVIRRLAPQVSALALNVNRSHDTYATFNLPLVADELTGFAGPLAGLAAGMQYFRTAQTAEKYALLATAPCDTPCLPTDFVRRLLEAKIAANAEIAVCETDSGAQPVCALYDISLLESLQTFLATGRRKIDVWTAQHLTVHVKFTDERAFSNLNTVADLQANW